ncbi:MAG: phospholipase D-like domain-containing protein, partial [Thermoplasmatota archaeon]
FGETIPDTTISVEPEYTELGSYQYRFEQRSIEGEFKVTPVLSPDSSMSNDTVLDMISSASEYIKVEQFYAYDWPYNRTNPYIEELIRAARRGVEVQIILDSTWYNIRGKDNNDEMVNRLNRLSSEGSIPIEAKLIEEGHGLKKVHNKGMIVDGEKALVSSINWNANSILQNREVGVIIENKKAARYFEKVFDSDWREDTITPIADAGRDEEVVVGEVHNFDASNSWDDENITTYLWDLDGDGRYESEGKKVSMIYKREGTRQIKLYTEDKEGNSDVDTATITVKEKSGFEFVEQEHDGSGDHLAIYILSTVIVVAVSIFLYKTRSTKD